MFKILHLELSNPMVLYGYLKSKGKAHLIAKGFIQKKWIVYKKDCLLFHRKTFLEL